MVSLGKFGVERADEVIEEVDFDYFDGQIRLTPDVFTDLDLVDLMESLSATDEKDPSAIRIIKDMFRQVLHPDDFDQFWALAKSHRQKIEDLMSVYQVLLEALTNRPTQRQSDSSAGPPLTPGNSQVVSSSAVVSAGRPDLQIVHDDAAAGRARIAQAALTG